MYQKTEYRATEYRAVHTTGRPSTQIVFSFNFVTAEIKSGIRRGQQTSQQMVESLTADLRRLITGMTERYQNAAGSGSGSGVPDGDGGVPSSDDQKEDQNGDVMSRSGNAVNFFILLILDFFCIAFSGTNRAFLRYRHVFPRLGYLTSKHFYLRLKT